MDDVTSRGGGCEMYKSLVFVMTAVKNYFFMPFSMISEWSRVQSFSSNVDKIWPRSRWWPPWKLYYIIFRKFVPLQNGAATLESSKGPKATVVLWIVYRLVAISFELSYFFVVFNNILGMYLKFWPDLSKINLENSYICKMVLKTGFRCAQKHRGCKGLKATVKKMHLSSIWVIISNIPGMYKKIRRTFNSRSFGNGQFGRLSKL